VNARDQLTPLLSRGWWLHGETDQQARVEQQRGIDAEGRSVEAKQRRGCCRPRRMQQRGARICVTLSREVSLFWSTAFFQP
jgi:hypothetical protein